MRVDGLVMLFRIFVLLNLDLLTHARHRRQEIDARDMAASGRICNPPPSLDIVPSSPLHTCPPVTLKDADGRIHGAFSRNSKTRIACLSLVLLPLYKIPGCFGACAEKRSPPPTNFNAAQRK